MSLIQLTEDPGKRRNGRQARERVLALVTQLDPERLDVAEELLADIVSHQHADTRRLTVAELDALSRAGVTEAALAVPSSFAATARGQLWERQAGREMRTVAETAELLGVTSARVRQRCAAGTLLAQRRSDGWYLPAFQFPDDREVPGWSTVARAIPATAPLTLVERVLTSPASRLGVGDELLAPFEWLSQGGDPGIAAAAVDDGLNRLP